MRKALIIKELRDRKLSLFTYIVISIGFIVMYTALFPSIQKEAESYTKLFESMPEAFAELAGITNASFNTLENFLAIELFSITWPLLLILLALSRAGSSVSGEVEKGSMGLLLSMPISRTKVITSKYAAGLLSVFLFTALSTLIIIPIASLFNYSVHADRIALLALSGLLFGSAIYSFAFLISVLFSERSKTYFVAAGAIIASYVLNIVGSLKESLHPLQSISIFNYFDATNAIVNGTISTAAIVVCLVVTAASTALAVVIFTKRDIQV
jgi:ABC-2 type transport system permease protein